MENNVQGIGQGRILFTGNGDHLVDNLISHISKQYKLSKCPPMEGEFDAALRQFHPHVLVVCLQNEDYGTLAMYHMLADDMKYMELPVLVIGKQDDIDLFRQRVHIKKMMVFPRPVDVERIQEELEQQTAIALVIEEQSKVHVATGDMAETAASEDAAGIPPQTADDAARFSILVVDDDVRMLNSIKLFLQDLYDVTVVPSGKLALKFLEKKHADIVLLDYMMPEMDGPEVLRRIRTGAKPETPVLFLTGIADRDQVMRCIALRPNGYLLKPVDRQTLIERVTAIILGL